MRSSLAVSVVVRYLGKLTTYTEAWLLNAATIQFAAGPGFVDQADLVLDEIALYPHKITDAEVLTLAQRQISDPVRRRILSRRPKGRRPRCKCSSTTPTRGWLDHDHDRAQRRRRWRQHRRRCRQRGDPGVRQLQLGRRRGGRYPFSFIPDYRRDRHIGACDRHRHGDCRRGGAVNANCYPTNGLSSVVVSTMADLATAVNAAPAGGTS